MKNKQLYLYFVYSIFFALLLVLNIYTPYFGDDYGYMYQIGTDNLITNPLQIFPSQYVHHFTYNGREVVHGLDQLFFLMPKMVFNVCNALVFCVLVYLISSVFCCNLKKWQYGLSMSIIVFIILWKYMPQAAMTMAWQTGSFNYMWTVVASLFFVLLFKKAINKELDHIWLWALLSFFIGWGHEGVSVGIAGAIVLYLLIRRKSINSQSVSLGIAYCIGTAVLISSPAMWHRGMSGDLEFHLMKGLIATLNRMILGGWLPLFTAFAVATVIYVILKPKSWWNFVSENLFIHLAVVIYFLFNLATQFVGLSRGAIGLEMCSLILILKIIYPLLQRLHWSVMMGIAAVGLCIFVLDYYTVITSCKLRSEQVQQMIVNWENTPEGEYTPNPLTVAENGRMLYSGFGLDNEHNWNQYLFCRYYGNRVVRVGVGEMKALPTEIYDIVYGISDVSSSHLKPLYDNLYLDESSDNNFYVLDDDFPADHCTIHIDFVKQRKGLTRQIAKLLHKSDKGSYVTTATVIRKNNHNYILFDRYDRSYGYPVPITNITVAP